MKRPSETSKLETHREQALNYWRNASDAAHNVSAPRFVVLCSCRRFEIWEPGAYPTESRVEFDLVELPDRIDALMFLADREPVFVASQEAVTRQVVSLMTGLYHQLGDRLAASPGIRRNFLLQTVWCLFAEDLGQLKGHLFTRIGRLSRDLLGLRSTLCREHEVGLTTLYNRVDEAHIARCAPRIAILIWPSSRRTGGAAKCSTTFVNVTVCCSSEIRSSWPARSRTRRSDGTRIAAPVVADSPA